MTTNDTPLTDIAHLLPPEQAGRLVMLAAPIQNAVLVDTRMLITRWEQSGVELDPITFSRVLGPTVDALMINAMAIFSLASGAGNALGEEGGR